MELPNAGSIFKNTPVEKISPEVLAQFQGIVKTDPFPVVPTAGIISAAGLKGLTVGRAQLSPKHTNYIVNLGGATATEIIGLIGKIQAAVKDKYGLDLEIEPQIISDEV